jgi:hypothetical protein
VWARLVYPHWIWLPVAIAVELLAYLGYTLTYRDTARAEGGAELATTRAAALVTTGFGVFLQGGGFALDREALKRSGLSEREAGARVLGLAAFEYAVLAPAAMVAAAVVLIGGLVTGVVLTLNRASESSEILAAPGGVASPPDSGSELPESGDSEADLEELSVSLQSNLNNRDVDGLLETVCEDGKVDDRARNYLIKLPFLDPTSSQYSEPIDFPEGSISPNDDGSYFIKFIGNYTSSGEPIPLVFKARVYPDGSGAGWCGIG